MSTQSIDPNLPLHPEEIVFLKSLLYRANQFVYSHDPNKEFSFITDSRKAPLREPQDLYIACVAFRMPDPRYYRDPLQKRRRKNRVFDDSNETVLYSDSQDFDRKVLVKAMEKIEEALGNFPLHFVLFNELAVSFKNTNGFPDHIWDITKRMRHAQYPFFLLPGTFHCPKSFLNVAPILPPFPDSSLKKASWGMPQFVVKQTRATKQAERIRTSDDREFRYYLTSYANFMELICLDFYDPSLILKLFRHNLRLSEDRPPEDQLIDLVFVPSFNRDRQQDLHAAALNVSNICRTTLVFSNTFPGKHGWTDSFICSFGKNVDPVFEYSPKSEKYSLKIFKLPNWSNRRVLQCPVENSGMPSNPFCNLFGDFQIGISRVG